MVALTQQHTLLEERASVKTDEVDARLASDKVEDTKQKQKVRINTLFSNQT